MDARERDVPAPPRQKDGLTSTGSYSPKTQYLILYNIINASLWLTVLVRVVLTTTLKGTSSTYDELGGFTKRTQTVAVLEIIHAAIGIVRAPVFTTLMQVYSRLAIIWGIIDVFPHLAKSPAYSTMLVAYGCTEVIRYSFFALNLTGNVPAFLHWLRYSTFIVLYPLGISSEYWLMWKAYGPAKHSNSAIFWFAVINLLAWPPSAYVLITHMMAQRRKVLGRRDSKKLN